MKKKKMGRGEVSLGVCTWANILCVTANVSHCQILYIEERFEI